MYHTLRVTLEFGRGLYATQLVKAETIIMTCELLVLNEIDTVKVNDTDLKYYTFKYDQTQDCLILGDGEIFNHSDNANVSYQLTQVDGRKVMVFVSKRDINPGDQLMIDYNLDTQVNTNDYINNNLFKGV